MRRRFLLHHGMPTLTRCLLVQALGALMVWLCCLPIVGQAHAAAPITPSGLNTEVSPPLTLPSGQTQYNITGGTRPGGGANLFHSFGDFSVPNNNIANFLNAGSIDVNGNLLDSNLPTSNILGRVTGGDPSAIFGMIQTNGTGGFGNANLFLMNPHGFLFGPNATLNVGGMMTFTTADYLRFQNTDTLFNKVSTPESLNLLSTVPVAAFGFLGSNPAAIAIQGSTLRVAQGQTLSFVGGNTGFKYIDPDTGITSSTSVPGGVTMTGGKLLALGGKINIASVASPGEVSAVDFMAAPGMTMGSINLSQGALLDVSADAAGTVRIRGGQFVIDSATISADTNNADGAHVAIDINVTGDMSLANDLSPTLTARTTGSGNAGSINVQSGNLDAITSSSDSLVALIDTHTSGTGTDAGTAGSVTITTGNLHAGNGAFFIDTGTAGTGHGGDINIQGTDILIETATIATGNQRFGQLLGLDVSGSGGNLSMKAAESLELRGSTISAEAWFAEAGNIILVAPDIFVNSGAAVALDGDFGGATMRVNADRLRLDGGSRLENNTVVDPGGDTIINVKVVELTRGSFIQTSTLGDGTAGNITLTATEHLTIDDRANTSHLVSGLISTVQEDSFGTFGGSGSITVKTPQLEMFGGGIINTTTRNSGNSGDVSIFANSVTISGQREAEFPGSILELGTTRGSGIYTRTVGSDLCVDACGNAGNITIVTDSLNLDSGGTINSGTINNGPGGNITINARNTISMSGTLSDGSPVGIFSRTIGTASDSGSGGNIALSAGQSITISDGASASASSTGAGDAGTITIQGLASPAQSMLIDGPGSGVFTDTQGTGAGGNIFVTANSVTLQNGGTLSAKTSGPADTSVGGTIAVVATDTVAMTNHASISASSTGTADAGNINITAMNGFTMQNSTITTDAGQGAGGGNIKVATSPSATVLLQDTSLISASVADGRGGGGNISIDPQYVILQNSQILAQAAQGQGGAITIIANLFLPDANSLVNADSGSGVNGTVTIQSPNAPVSGQIQPLNKMPLLATSLLNQHCAALAGGQFSSFTVAGRDSLPTEPGSWLGSLLYAAGVGTGEGLSGLSSLSGVSGVVRGGLAAHQIDQIDQTDQSLLSLRQIAPAGFLTQAFAVDEPAGCQS